MRYAFKVINYLKNHLFFSHNHSSSDNNTSEQSIGLEELYKMLDQMDEIASDRKNCLIFYSSEFSIEKKKGK